MMTREEKMEINDISLAIGELRSDARNTKDAVLRIERSIEKITGSLSTLPPSPVCIAKHEELERKITDLRLQNAKHATIISGIVAAAAMFGKSLLQSLGVLPPAPH